MPTVHEPTVHWIYKKVVQRGELSLWSSHIQVCADWFLKQLSNSSRTQSCGEQFFEDFFILWRPLIFNVGRTYVITRPHSSSGRLVFETTVKFKAQELFFTLVTWFSPSLTTNNIQKGVQTCLVSRSRFDAPAANQDHSIKSKSDIIPTVGAL